MTEAGEIVLGFVPLFGALMFALSWLIKILTGLENRLTVIETVMRIHKIRTDDSESGHEALG